MKTVCCSNVCELRQKCAKHAINNEGINYCEDFSFFGSGTISGDGCTTDYWCGELGKHKMFEPVNRVSKETLQELEDILSKLGIAVRDENGNDRLSGDILNDIKEKIRKDFGT